MKFVINRTDSRAGQEVAREQGFTLIEILVVVAIIGILSLLGFSYMGGVTAKFRLNATVREMGARLRTAQMLSIMKNEPITVVNNSTGYYACLDEGTLEDCTDSTEQYINLDSGRDASGQIAATIDYAFNVYIYNSFLGTAPPATSPNAITYKPPSGLPVPITDGGGSPKDGTLCLQVQTDDALYESRRIRVDKLIGKVKLFKTVDPVTTVNEPDCSDESLWEEM